MAAILSSGELKLRIILEPFPNPDTTTVNEHPLVTTLLSGFVNAKPVNSCFETRTRLVEFFTSEYFGELLELVEIPLNKYM